MRPGVPIWKVGIMVRTMVRTMVRSLLCTWTVCNEVRTGILTWKVRTTVRTTVRTSARTWAVRNEVRTRIYTWKVRTTVRTSVRTWAVRNDVRLIPLHRWWSHQGNSGVVEREVCGLGWGSNEVASRAARSNLLFGCVISKLRGTQRNLGDTSVDGSVKFVHRTLLGSEVVKHLFSTPVADCEAALVSGSSAMEFITAALVETSPVSRDRRGVWPLVQLTATVPGPLSLRAPDKACHRSPSLQRLSGLRKRTPSMS